MVATPSAITAPPRRVSRATSTRWCSQTSIFSLQMHRPSPPPGACAKHSRVTRNGTSDILHAAQLPTITGQASQHLENSTIQMHHVEGYTDLEWPIDARNRRNVSCASLDHAQTRPEITPYPKSARNGTSNSARNSAGAPRNARHSKCAISRSKHELKAACPCTQSRRKALHT